MPTISHISNIPTSCHTSGREQITAIPIKQSYPTRFLEILLVQRLEKPERNKWALPGGFTNLALETLEQAAVRELKEEANLDAEIRDDRAFQTTRIHLKQLKAYYAPGRDKRGPTPTVAFVALVNEGLLSNIKAGGDAKQARLFRIHLSRERGITCESAYKSIVLEHHDFAFDHAKIISDALRFIQKEILTTTIAATLLSEEFTIAELHQVISTIVPTYGPLTTNFGRDLVKTKSRDAMLEEVLDEHGDPKKTSRHSARPAQLYRFRGDFVPEVSIYPRV